MAAALGGALLSLSVAHAATITVTTGVDLFGASAGEGCSLRDAIQAANANANFGDCIGDGVFGSDVIVFAPGVTTVTLTNTNTTLTGNDDNAYLDLDILADNPSASGGVTLTIDGGPNGVVIEGDPSGWADRIFDIVSSSATTASVVLRNLTIQGGLVPASSPNETGTGADPCFGGGGVRNRSGGSLALQNVGVQTNAAATRGGGVCHQSGGALIIESSRILANTANVTGGGLWEQAASLLLQSSELRGNTAISSVGGGLATVGGVASKVISNSLIAFNQAEGDGGGIAAQVLVLEDAEVSYNLAQGASASGGGLASYGALTVTNALVVSNTATGGAFVAGGGIKTIGQSAFISETQVLSNTAGRGGGWDNGATSAHTYNSVVRFNRAFYTGPNSKDGGAFTTPATTCLSAQA